MNLLTFFFEFFNLFNFKSLYYIPQIIILMVFILAIASLLTVLERKALASCQRRLGPSYHGWFGLLQIVGDGIKLIFKDSSLLGLFRSSVTVNNNTFNTNILAPLWIFCWSYLVFIIFWTDYSLLINIPFIFLIFFIIQGTAHIGLVVVGLYTQSRWTVLASIRSLIVYIVYDMILLVSWIILLPHAKLGNNLYESINIGTINSYLESQEITWNIIQYPWLVLFYSIATLVESGRIPSDLTEAESELVSGFNTEFGGFLYALFASAEYSAMFFNALLISLLLLGGGSITSLFLKFSLVFLFFIWIRATLPRLRYTDLLIWSWSYIIPFQILGLSILFIF